MHYKLLLAGLLIMPAIRIADPSQVSMHKPVKENIGFNGMHKNAQAKHVVKAAVPFWELGKQKEISFDSTSLKQSNWYANALKGIAESEYTIRYDEQSKRYASPNRKNNLLAFYTGSTFSLVPRNDSADKWKLDLTQTF